MLLDSDDWLAADACEKLLALIKGKNADCIVCGLKQTRFINATDCADYLVKKGMPFRTAYKITGGLVAHCIELGTTLEELPLADYQKQSDLFTDDVYEAISLDTCVRERKSFGGPAPESVKKQIELTRKKLEELCNG